MKFNKGAFHSEMTIKPVYLTYKYSHSAPSLDCIPSLSAFIVALSSPFGISCELNVLPDFKPNKFLFENHTDHGEERWELIAWAVRDVMLQSSKLRPCDFSLKQKALYQDYMLSKEGA
jgi:hypothetical protein